MHRFTFLFFFSLFFYVPHMHGMDLHDRFSIVEAAGIFQRFCLHRAQTAQRQEELLKIIEIERQTLRKRKEPAHPEPDSKEQKKQFVEPRKPLLLAPAPLTLSDLLLDSDDDRQANREDIEKRLKQYRHPSNLTYKKKGRTKNYVPSSRSRYYDASKQSKSTGGSPLRLEELIRDKNANSQPAEDTSPAQARIPRYIINGIDTRKKRS